MKTIKIISLLVTSLLMFSLNSFSHGSCKNRNDCNWSVNGSWQYKSTARVTKWGWPQQTSDKDCPYIPGSGIPSTPSTDGYCWAYKNNDCAYQLATNNFGSWNFSGSVSRRICSRGGLYSDLFYDSQSNEEENDEFEASSINTTTTIFEEDKVIIESINGYLVAKGENMYSSFELIFWLPKSTEDNILNEEKTFYTSKIELLNGKLILSENLPRESFELVTKDNGEVLVKINNLKIEAYLPDGINGKKNIIEAIGTTDGGVKEEQAINDIIEKSDDKIEFTLSPNPSEGDVSITFTQSELLKNTSIKLYDNSGKFIKNIKINGEYNKNTIEKFNLYDFTSIKGIYFIMIQSELSTSIKKVILM